MTAIRHFLNTQDWSRPDLDALLADAARFKREKLGTALKGDLAYWDSLNA